MNFLSTGRHFYELPFYGQIFFMNFLSRADIFYELSFYGQIFFHACRYYFRNRFYEGHIALEISECVLQIWEENTSLRHVTPCHQVIGPRCIEEM